MRRPAFFVLALAAATSGPALADVFEYIGGTSGNWGTSTNWSKTSGSSARTVPNDVTDTAVLNKNTTTDWSILVNSSSRTLGQITFSAGTNSWTKIWLTSEWNANPTSIRLQGATGPAIITASTATTEATFGNRYNKTDAGSNNLGIILGSPLQITKTTGGAFTVYMGYPSTGKQAPMSSAGGNKYDITVAGSGGSVLTAAFQSQLSTNRSDYFVNAASGPAVLAYFGDSALGDSANRIYLQNGGVARLAQVAAGTSATAGTVSTARTIFGTGTIQGRLTPTSGTAVGLTLASGGVLSPGEGIGTLAIQATSFAFDAGSALNIELASDTSFDQVTANSNVTLGGELNLMPLYTPVNGQSWTILTSTGVISSDFANKESLPEGYSYSVQNAGHDLVLTYAVPEPSMLALLGLAGLTLARRRGRQDGRR